MGKIASCCSVYYVIISFLNLLAIFAMFSCEICFFWNQFNKMHVGMMSFVCNCSHRMCGRFKINVCIGWLYHIFY